ncbi:Cysteine synthase [Planctomycetes bacterium Pan216]|uniref:cysteine synthase n=1 Tax=Kolteria novifilia TaxID=2527975 RepID=A0A518B862_9BACT|nr:Cysteine synthase [Planctomycetes bacterium Pan216]
MATSRRAFLQWSATASVVGASATGTALAQEQQDGQSANTIAHGSQASGKTPLVHLSRAFPEQGPQVLAKMETMNPTGSHKDRIARSMIDSARKGGKLSSDPRVVAASAGPFGIALASVCAAESIPTTIVIPDNVSPKVVATLQQLGADVVATPAAEGMKGAHEKAAAIAEKTPNSWFADQFSDPVSMQAYHDTLGPELWEDANGKVDVLVLGVGSGGSLSGVGKYLKEKNPNIEVIAVEPEASAALSGGEHSPHQMHGIGVGFVAKNVDRDLLDRTMKVSNDDAAAWQSKVGRLEGIPTGLTSAANLAAIAKLANDPAYKGKRICTCICDNGSRESG